MRSFPLGHATGRVHERCRSVSQAVANRFGALKEELACLGLTRPGSLVERYMLCGMPGCRCMGDTPVLHGPYHQWTHKVRGKTVTKRST